MNLINRRYLLIPILITTLFTLDPAYGQEKFFDSVAKLIDPAAMQEAESRKIVNWFQEQYAIERQVYRISRVPVQSLLRLIEPELRTYYLVSKTKFTDVTSERWEDVRFDSKRVGKIVREGTDYAITSAVGGKVTKEGDVWRSPVTEAGWFVQTHQESIQVLEGGQILQVAGTHRLHAQVGRLVDSLSHITEVTGEQSASVNAYRLEVVLLKGGKAGEVALTNQRGIGLSFGMEGTISRLPKVGAHVEQGEQIATLDTSLIVAEARSEGIDKAEMAVYLRMMVIEAPVAGTIASLEVRGLQVGEGQTIATLIPDVESTQAGAGARYSIQVAQQYGIAPEDIAIFGFDGFVELGKAVFWLSRSRGEDRSRFDLGDAYKCELRIQDIRPPYLVLNAELKGARKGLDTTIYLEADKPSVVGITNMTEALLLVIKVVEKR